VHEPYGLQAAYLAGRREYTRELEAVFASTPFESYSIQRGKTKQAGALKGVFRVVESRSVTPTVDLSALRTPKLYHVRVYVMTGGWSCNSPLMRIIPFYSGIILCALPFAVSPCLQEKISLLPVVVAL
jgi:hypothetical protein